MCYLENIEHTMLPVEWINTHSSIIYTVIISNKGSGVKIHTQKHFFNTKLWGLKHASIGEVFINSHCRLDIFWTIKDFWFAYLFFFQSIIVKVGFIFSIFEEILGTPVRSMLTSCNPKKISVLRVLFKNFGGYTICSLGSPDPWPHMLKIHFRWKLFVLLNFTDYKIIHADNKFEILDFQEERWIQITSQCSYF